MPAWFMDIESATEAAAKSNATPPASRTPSQASRANSPRSALHGVTRLSVEATPTNGFSRSASFNPSARRNARCGARSSPSTVMRERSFFVLTNDLFDVGATRKAEPRRVLRTRALRRTVHHRLHGRIGREAHSRRGLRPHGVPHLLCAYADAIQEKGALRADTLSVQESLHHLVDRDARKPCLWPHGTNIIASRERLADDRARPSGHRGVRAARTHEHRGQAQRPAVDVAPARVIADQDLAHEFLRAVRKPRRGRRVIGDFVDPAIHG